MSSAKEFGDLLSCTETEALCWTFSEVRQDFSAFNQLCLWLARACLTSKGTATSALLESQRYSGAGLQCGKDMHEMCL